MRDMSVAPYSPKWPTAFAAEAARLRMALGDLVVRIHHIGSTAVPGLAAKPVIDILLEVRDLSQLDASDRVMESLGYLPRGEYGIAGRRYYPKGGDARSHHVHAFVVGDEHVAKHLAFRDFLRSHPAVAAAYAETKRAAVTDHRHDPEGYQLCKREFIARTLHQAVAWVRGSKSDR